MLRRRVVGGRLALRRVRQDRQVLLLPLFQNTPLTSGAVWHGDLVGGHIPYRGRNGPNDFVGLVHAKCYVYRFLKLVSNLGVLPHSLRLLLLVRSVLGDDRETHRA